MSQARKQVKPPSDQSAFCLQYIKYKRRSEDMKKRLRLTDQLRRVIDGSGMSRYAICKATGTDQGSMSRFMAAKSGLSFQSLDRIGELFNLHLVKSGRPRKRKGQ